jgi:hypothetical protein
VTTKLMVNIAFGGGLGDPEFTNDPGRDFELDPERAELRQAGYDVYLTPEKLSPLLAHPLDDFIEALIEAPDDPKVINAIINEVNVIVEKYGGVGPHREGLRAVC